MARSKNKLMKSTPSAEVSRRAFIRQACCAAVGTTGILSALSQLRVIGASAGDSLGGGTLLPGDFKALVCLFLKGGYDATNLLIPADGSNYAAYAKIRGEIAVAQSALLPIAPLTYSDGRNYGLHPSALGLQALFNQKKMAVLANVGTLVRPTTLSDYVAGRNLPPQLFAHNEQQVQWQSSIPDRIFETGWGGRLADIMDVMNSNNQIAMSLSFGGTNLFQRGATVGQFSLFPGGVEAFSYQGSSLFTQRKTAVTNLLAAAAENQLAGAFGGITKEAIANNELMGTVLAAAPKLNTVFPGTSTGAQLAMVAKLISVSQTLGLKRQIFFVQLDGWDTHGAQKNAFTSLLTEISDSMKAFYDSTVELGVANQVTTFTASDFGRTYAPNYGGTDHGWGNHQLIMGGAVQGGDIYGQMPSLTIGANDDTGRGRWIPSTSVDEYNATLATWFGVSAANLSTVLPNIGRFAKPNLGFMG